jgi:hypothetical protein
MNASAFAAIACAASALLAGCLESAPSVRQLEAPSAPDLSGVTARDVAEPVRPDVATDSSEEDLPAGDDASVPPADTDPGADVADPDAATPDTAAPLCGNGVLDLGERCDIGLPQTAPGACPAICPAPADRCATARLDGEGCDQACVEDPIVTCRSGDACCPAGCDAARDTDCAPTCGNAVVEPGETCDGDCPQACDDGLACTTDLSSGLASRCDLACSFMAITSCGLVPDGCCPNGCNSNNDGDCSPSCGNGTRERGETCDPPGTCPTSCDDGSACTADRLTGSAATCSAVCTSTPVTACASGDGCCPGGCNSLLDADCLPRCGNGVIEPTETCDGNCPRTCDDGLACTKDALEGAASACTARCTATPISACASGDGCCPAGCSSSQDSDCGARCGNNVKEGSEACDGTATPANRTCTSACTLVPVTSLRVSTLLLREPHLSASGLFGCADITVAVNSSISSSVRGDSNGNGFLDLSYFSIFEGLDTSAPSALRHGFVEGLCTATRPMSCALAGATPAWGPVTLQAATSAPSPCLGLVGDNLGYPNDIRLPFAEAGAPCFASAATTLVLSVAGVDIPLVRARVAGVLFNRGGELRSGLLRGFLSLSAASTLVFPASTPLVGGRTLASLLPGGPGACGGVGGLSTVDGQRGWWFYLNFDAVQTPLTDL